MKRAKIRDVHEVCDYFLMNKNLGGYYVWDDERNCYTDGEIEYQLRDYTNGDFESILVRYTDDDTHCYKEFKEYNYSTVGDLFEDVFSDETEEELYEMVERKLRARDDR